MFRDLTWTLFKKKKIDMIVLNKTSLLLRTYQFHFWSIQNFYIVGYPSWLLSVCHSCKGDRIWVLGIRVRYACCCYVWLSLDHDSNPSSGMACLCFCFTYLSACSVFVSWCTPHFRCTYCMLYVGMLPGHLFCWTCYNKMDIKKEVYGKHFLAVTILMGF